MRNEDTSISRRVKAAFDRTVETESRSDQDIAVLLRELEVDIAVDLMGYTGGTPRGHIQLPPGADSSQLFAASPAPRAHRTWTISSRTNTSSLKNGGPPTANAWCTCPSVSKSTMIAAPPLRHRRGRRRAFPPRDSCGVPSTATTRSIRLCSTSGLACSLPFRGASFGSSAATRRSKPICAARPNRAAWMLRGWCLRHPCPTRSISLD